MEKIFGWVIFVSEVYVASLLSILSFWLMFHEQLRIVTLVALPGAVLVWTLAFVIWKDMKTKV